jgi:hypothetical protein
MMQSATLHSPQRTRVVGKVNEAEQIGIEFVIVLMGRAVISNALEWCRERDE